MNAIARPEQAEAYRFHATFEQTGSAGASAKGARKFSGIGYSGDVIENHWYWDRVVFDISTTSSPQKLPLLMNHERDRIAGYTDSVAMGNAIAITGTLSSKTDEGQQVAALMDEGFPWQMSVHIEPANVDQVPAGQVVTVNGRQFTGPLNVFRNSTIREISFTPTGWDDQTSAVAMSHQAAAPSRFVRTRSDDAVINQAQDMAERARGLMASAAERGESIDACEAVRRLKMADRPDSSLTAVEKMERVALRARELVYQYSLRGQRLEVADAVMMIKAGRA